MQSSCAWTVNKKRKDRKWMFRYKIAGERNAKASTHPCTCAAFYSSISLVVLLAPMAAGADGLLTLSIRDEATGEPTISRVEIVRAGSAGEENLRFARRFPPGSASSWIATLSCRCANPRINSA